MINTAQRMRHLTSHFFAKRGARIAELRSQGVDIIRLDEGSPDLPPPTAVIDTLAREAARPDVHGYQPHRGPSALRRAWAGIYRSVWGVDLDPELEILPLLGSKEGIFHISMAYIQPGEVALVPDPGYVTYERGPLFAGAELHRMPLRPEHGFTPELERISPSVLQRAKLLWLNYPNNPTSALAPLSFFEQVVDFARRHDLLVCHDAAYSRVTFNPDPAPSILQVPGALDVTVEFNTLSKSHNMAGWRSAAILGNRDVVRNLFTLKTNTDSSHFKPVFEASVVALGTDQAWIDARNQVYRQRRDALGLWFENAGDECAAARSRDVCMVASARRLDELAIRRGSPGRGARQLYSRSGFWTGWRGLSSLCAHCAAGTDPGSCRAYLWMDGG